VSQFVLDVNLQIQKVLGLEEVKQQLSGIAGSTANVGIGVKGAQQSAAALGATSAAAQAATTSIANLGIVSNKSEVELDNLIKSVKLSGGAVQQSAGLFDNYATRVGLAGARYSAFLVATALPFAGLAAIGTAIQSIVEFDAAMVKLSQILQAPQDDIDALREKILQLSTATGTSITEISKAANTLGQAGLLKGAEDFARFLEPLSKVPLLPTFKNIEEATEGVIAALGQFKDAGLEPIEILDKLTKVAKDFAVESSDLNKALQIAGGTFSQLGGNLDEFLALFTTIRQTTREDASSIATALKTIATRLAQPATVAFLESIGVSIRDQKGELLGLVEVFQNLQEVFNASGKEQQSLIGTQLGGVRNVGRVFAGLRNTDLTREVLASSQTSGGAFTAGAEEGLEKLSTQIDILKAKFIELAQSLAEPVFLPIIEAALAAGHALVYVVETMKPVLPLLVQLIALGAGLKVFTLAANSIGGLGKALAALNLGGLDGLGSGTNAAAGQTGVITGFGSQQPQKGGTFASSQIGQLGALAGLNIIAGQLSATFKKTDDSIVKLGLNAAQTATGILALASIATGKSVTDLFKALGPAAGIGVGAGIAGISAAFAIANQTEINIDELVQKAAKEINELNIKIEPGDAGDLQNALDKIAKPVGEMLTGVSDQFDTGTFIGLARATADHIKDIFTLNTDVFGTNIADVVNTGGAISNDDINKFIKDILGSGKDSSKIVSEAVGEFGLDFKAGLQAGLEKSFAPLASMGVDVKKAAQLVTDKLIKDIGGLQGAVKLDQQRQKEEANRAVVASTAKIADDLNKIIIPEQLGGELKLLSEAVKNTVAAIDSSISAFQSGSGTIGKIASPQLPTTLTDEAVRSQLRNATPSTFGEAAPNLSKATQQVLEVNQAVKDFETSFERALSQVREQLSGGEVDPSKMFAKFAEDYIAGAENLSEEGASAIRKSSAEISATLVESFGSGKTGLKTEEVLEIVKRGFGNITEITDAMVAEAKKFFEASLRLENIRNSALDQRANIEQGSSLPTTQLEVFDRAMEKLGHNMGKSASSVDGASAEMVSLGGDFELAKDLLAELGPAQTAATTAFKEAELAARNMSTSKEDMSQLAIKSSEAQDKVRFLTIALASLAKFADISLQDATKNKDPEQTGTSARELDAKTTKDLATLGTQLTQLNSIEDASGIFNEASDTFRTSVNDLKGHFDVLSQKQIDFLADLQSKLNVLKEGKFSGDENDAAQKAQKEAVDLNTQKIVDKLNDIFVQNQKAPGILDALTGNKRTDLRNPGAIEQNMMTDILAQNKADPSNPLGVFGQTQEEFQKNINLSIDPEDLSKLQITFSVETFAAIEQLTHLPVGVPPPVEPVVPPLPPPQPLPVPLEQGAPLSDASVEMKEASVAFAGGSEMFGTAVTSLTTAVEPLSSIGETLSAANELQASQVAEANQTFLDGLGATFEGLTTAMQANIEQQAEAAKVTEVEDPTDALLASAAEATAENTETLTGTTEGMVDLSTQLADTSNALKEGLNMKLESVQQVNVDVTGVSEEVAHLEQKMAVVAREIARELINQAMSQLAAAAGSSEDAERFNSSQV